MDQVKRRENSKQGAKNGRNKLYLRDEVLDQIDPKE